MRWQSPPLHKMGVSPQNGSGIPITVGGDHRRHPEKHDPRTLEGPFGPEPAQNFLQFGCSSPVSRPDPSSLAWGALGAPGYPAGPRTFLQSCPRTVTPAHPQVLPWRCPLASAFRLGQKNEKKEKKGLLRVRTRGQLQGRRAGAGPVPRRELRCKVLQPLQPPQPAKHPPGWENSPGCLNRVVRGAERTPWGTTSPCLKHSPVCPPSNASLQPHHGN